MTDLLDHVVIFVRYPEHESTPVKYFIYAYDIVLPRMRYFDHCALSVNRFGLYILSTSKSTIGMKTLTYIHIYMYVYMDILYLLYFPCFHYLLSLETVSRRGLISSLY